jgi:integrase
MPKVIAPLSDLAVKNLKKPGIHSVGGVPGLKLQISNSMARSWILRATIAGKVCDVGLGSYPTIPLKIAREMAKSTRIQIQQGIDPIAEKQRIKDAAALERASRKTFDECAESCILSMEPEWSNPKSAQQWRNTLATYASPTLGKLPISAIETKHILSVLEPIWSKKPETASRVRGRIEKVLAYATTRGYREGDNPAKYKGHLDTTLPQISKIKGKNHHPALDYHDIGRFMAELSKSSGASAKALKFSILTASRSGEVRGAKWSEIDLKKKQWTIPAERMKANRQHIVPLSKQALKLLEELPRNSDYVFPGARGGSMSDMALSKAVKDLHSKETTQGRPGFIDIHSNNRVVTPHGFRSTFRDWAGEQSPFPREVIEHALAHQLKDKAEAAYQRKTSIPKRIKLMQSWADFCNLLPSSLTSEVVTLNVPQGKGQ